MVARNGPSSVIWMSFKMNLTRSDLQRKPGNCFTVTVFDCQNLTLNSQLMTFFYVTLFFKSTWLHTQFICTTLQVIYCILVFFLYIYHSYINNFDFLLSRSLMLFKLRRTGLFSSILSWQYKPNKYLIEFWKQTV